MIQYIIKFWTFFYFISKLYLFTFLFQPLFKSCLVEKKIKKHGKTKIIQQPKSILAFVYFFLLYFMLNLFSFKFILFLATGFIFGSLIAYDRFSQDLSHHLKRYNSHPFVILIWKLFNSFLTIVYIITEPINILINKFCYKKFLVLKKIFYMLAKLETSDESYSFSDINKKLLKSEHTHKEHKDKSNISNISEYIIKSKVNKSKTKSKNEVISEDTTSSSKENTSETNSKNELVEKRNHINNTLNEDISKIEDITITDM